MGLATHPGKIETQDEAIIYRMEKHHCLTKHEGREE